MTTEKILSPPECNGKVLWLVDMGYVVKCTKETFRLDYLRTRTWLNKRFDCCVKTHLFNSFDRDYHTPPGLLSFYDQMRLGGMEVHLYPMAVHLGQHRQKQVDVAIGAHLVYFATQPQVETLVLTTGDADMIPAVELAISLGRRVLLLTHDINVSQALIEASTEYIRLGDNQRAFDKQ